MNRRLTSVELGRELKASTGVALASSSVHRVLPKSGLTERIQRLTKTFVDWATMQSSTAMGHMHRF